MIDALTGQGIDVRHACRVLGVSRGGYYVWKDRPLSKTGLRRIWLAKEIIEIHKQSRGTYGVPGSRPSSGSARESRSARTRFARSWLS